MKKAKKMKNKNGSCQTLDKWSLEAAQKAWGVLLPLPPSPGHRPRDPKKTPELPASLPALPESQPLILTAVTDSGIQERGDAQSSQPSITWLQLSTSHM